MAGGGELLRLLEPAVRPGGVQGPARTPVVPFESRSFEALLADAAREQSSLNVETTGGVALGSESRSPSGAAGAHLAGLSGVDRIENAGVLEAMAGRNANGER